MNQIAVINIAFVTSKQSYRDEVRLLGVIYHNLLLAPLKSVFELLQ